MEHIEYDDKLTSIKLFNTFLSNIIDKGYNNNMSTLKLIVKHINNFIIETSNSSISVNNSSDSDNSSKSSLSESSESSESSDSDSDNTFVEISQKERQLKKINDFIINSDNLSKIALYKKHNNLRNNMKQFIENSLIY